MKTDMAQGDDERRKANLRMALILASIAVVFFLGFIVKMAFLGGK